MASPTGSNSLRDLSPLRFTLTFMPSPGDLITTPNGAVTVSAPTHCPNGHKYVGGHNVVVGNYPCTCNQRHMQWACLEPGCGGVVYGPALGDGCGEIETVREY